MKKFQAFKLTRKEMTGIVAGGKWVCYKAGTARGEENSTDYAHVNDAASAIEFIENTDYAMCQEEPGIIEHSEEFLQG